MTTNLTRRNLLKFGAGGAVGIALTPAPWKLLDDVAIWSQNWSWIPRPPKGPSTMRATACALCPAGCAAQARCIGALPVAMRAASPDSPLCPLGLTAHHLPYHPARISRPMRVLHSGPGERRIPVAPDAAISALAGGIATARRTGRAVAVLDMRPGRSVSWAWQRLLGGIPNGVLVPAPGRDGANLATLQEMIGSGDSVGLDLDSVRTILSFRAPIGAGWGSRRIRDRIRDGSVQLIHVDPVRSTTADLANRWLAAKPGSEAVLADAIARSALECGGAAAAFNNEKRQQAAALQSGGSAAAEITGVPADVISAIANELVHNGPSLVVAAEGLGRQAEEAVHALNLLINGAVIPRSELPAPFADEALAPIQEIDRLADQSIAVLIVDASAGDVRFPWPVVQRKLHRDAIVVALTPFFAGTPRRADYVIPTLPSLEVLSEIPTPFDAPAPQLTIATPLLQPRKSAVDPVEIVRAIARTSRVELPGDWMKSEDLMRARVAAIQASGEGTVKNADGSTKPANEFSSAGELWDALAAGGVWEGAKATRSFRRPAPRPSVVAPAVKRASLPLLAIAHIPRDVTASAAVSPVMTKLYQESGLRRPPRTVVVNPATASQLRIANGANAVLESESARASVIVATDHAVMPGIVEVSAAPDALALGESATGAADILDIFSPDANGAWRTVAARLVEA